MEEGGSKMTEETDLTRRNRTVTERVLEVRVQSFEEFADQSEAALRQALEADEYEPAVLAFETPGQALSLFTDARYELLEAIRRERPGSIRELARVLDRDVRAVHRDLDALAEYGIVEFEADGRAKRPMVGYEEIRIDVDLTFGDAGEESNAAP